MALGNKLSAKNYSLWRKVRAKVIARDNGICQYCGEEGNEVDHILSRKRGGDDSLDNLLCCCRSCNLRKSSSDLSVFLERAHTPPVSTSRTSPRTVTKVLTGPFAGQPSPSQYLT